MKVILKNASLEFQVGIPKVDVTITDFTPDGVNIIARDFFVSADYGRQTNGTSVFIKLPEYTAETLNIAITKISGQSNNPVVGLFKSVPPADTPSGSQQAYVSTNEQTPIGTWDSKEVTSSDTKWLMLMRTQNDSVRSASSVRFYES